MKTITIPQKQAISVSSESEMYVNYGNLLERQLLTWKGGSQHPRGIAEYISNSDDSYRRLKKFNNQKIIIEIHSKSGRKIHKIIIKDFAEGMSYKDLENKFFKYYESYSGREKGQEVTGQFGTGGKAYATMNFKHCWITSRKNGFESKAWFSWDSEKKILKKGYNKGGYINREIDEENGTVVSLWYADKNNIELLDIVLRLQNEHRIRHVIKTQNVICNIYSKKQKWENYKINYDGPKDEDAINEWKFSLPDSIKNDNPSENFLILRQFEKKIDKNCFIDISDGISSVGDLDISKYDGRPFSKYINGSLIVRRLNNSSAIKENRKGLEEGDDLTEEIENFVQDKIRIVINEIEVKQREKERKRNIEVSNEKIKELNKFLKKCNLNFRSELRELKKKIKDNIDESENTLTDYDNDGTDISVYRKPTNDDPMDSLIRGKWLNEPGPELPPGPGPVNGVPRFIPDPHGIDYAVEVGKKRKKPSIEKRRKSGIEVLMSDERNLPDDIEKPVFSEYDDPVSDRDLLSKGIIWVNANNPIISKNREKKEKEPIFKELVVSNVLLLVAQYQAQKVLDTQPEDDRDDPMMLFRQRFFDLQNSIREDKEITYFEDEELAGQSI